MPFGSEAMFQFTPRRGRRTAVPRRVDAAAFARSVSVKGATDVPSRAFLGGANKFASVTHAFVHRGAVPVFGELAAASKKDAKDDASPKLTVKRLMERRPIAVVAHVMGTGLALLRGAGKTAVTMAKRHLLITLEVTSKDRAYPWVLQWLTEQAQHTSLGNGSDMHDAELEELKRKEEIKRAAMKEQALRAAEVRLLCGDAFKHPWAEAVSYTHLTLPTILLV